MIKKLFVFLSIFILFFLSLPYNLGSASSSISINENSFERLWLDFYTNLDDPSINYNCVKLGLRGFYKALNENELISKNIITLIDYTKPSTEERLFVIDIETDSVLVKSLVAHGKNSGINYAKNFSNQRFSNKSSLGFFITDETYRGKHGYSLRLKGLEAGINDSAYKRGIVIHPANYVSKEFIYKYGRLGRSFGCPAIPSENHKKIINLIKEKTCLFIYYPDSFYLSESTYLSQNSIHK